MCGECRVGLFRRGKWFLSSLFGGGGSHWRRRPAYASLRGPDWAFLSLPPRRRTPSFPSLFSSPSISLYQLPWAWHSTYTHTLTSGRARERERERERERGKTYVQTQITLPTLTYRNTHLTLAFWPLLLKIKHTIGALICGSFLHLPERERLIYKCAVRFMYTTHITQQCLPRMLSLAVARMVLSANSNNNDGGGGGDSTNRERKHLV